MEISRARTDRGSGRWGNATYSVELISCTRSWVNQDGTQHASVTSYDLVCPAPAGSRHFSTSEEREEFIRWSFNNLNLVPINPPEVWSEAQSLSVVVGQPLDSVEFVEDYFQLVWPDDILTVTSSVAICEGVNRWEEGAPHFRKSLRDLTGRHLIDVDEVLGRGLVLTFEGPAELEISLSEGPPGVVEAVELSSKEQGRRGAGWSVGEEPFLPSS
jgi:hypothetical protein